MKVRVTIPGDSRSLVFRAAATLEWLRPHTPLEHVSLLVTLSIAIMHIARFSPIQEQEQPRTYVAVLALISASYAPRFLESYKLRTRLFERFNSSDFMRSRCAAWDQSVLWHAGDRFPLVEYGAGSAGLSHSEHHSDNFPSGLGLYQVLMFLRELHDYHRSGLLDASDIRWLFGDRYYWFMPTLKDFVYQLTALRELQDNTPNDSLNRTLEWASTIFTFKYKAPSPGIFLLDRRTSFHHGSTLEARNNDGIVTQLAGVPRIVNLGNHRYLKWSGDKTMGSLAIKTTLTGQHYLAVHSVSPLKSYCLTFSLDPNRASHHTDSVHYWIQRINVQKSVLSEPE